ncbi:hypothetical protein SCP_0312800 [Sparassis crispa]|uniref:Uncharacterized protein n=1 Tax=Sparassis crispa TaxID=139825 RepID=A0A401GHF4_9APHY|nr:hypothetical protein SCP_0312800 [Sparassis crispa]GBE81551.1 hypothetical protein SCP_0312800 [Sparassis crispa]
MDGATGRDGNCGPAGGMSTVSQKRKAVEVAWFIMHVGQRGAVGDPITVSNTSLMVGS